MTAPSPETPSAPAVPRAPFHWLPIADAVLVLLVLLLAGLTTAFVSRNSDQWLHFAAGRDLLNGKYHLGSDPYSYLHENETWVNSSWAYDVIVYEIYIASPAAVTVMKALTFALAFLVVLRMRVAGTAAWPWWLLATVAVLAAAPLTTLRPIVVSALFVALTLYVLFRAEWRPGSWRYPLLLAGLTALWANLDQWFFLAPLTTLAVLLAGGTHTNKQSLLKAFALTLAASLLNPHLFGVWQIPFEFGLSMTEALRLENAFASVAMPAYSRHYFDNPGLGGNLNGIAFLVLLVSGGGCLALGLRRERLACLFVWMLYVVLALLNFRCILFFAVAAVPMVALPLSDLAARYSDDSSMKALSNLGRILAIPALLVLLFCAWPGWLHSKPSQPWMVNRVALGVEPDAGLARTAKLLDDWRTSGKLAGLHGTPLALDLSNHVAWFAPNEKVAVNSRLRHHAADLEKFVAPNAALRNDSLKEFTQSLADLGADYFIMTSPSAVRPIDGGVLNLARAGSGLSVWHLDGRAAVFGPPGKGVSYNPLSQVFGKDVSRLPEPNIAPPPSRNPEPMDAFFQTPKPVPPEALDAALLQAQAMIAWSSAVEEHKLANLALGVPTALLMQHMEPNLPDEALAANLLAQRRARQAMAANPDHPLAYGALALAVMENGVPLPGFNPEEQAGIFATNARRYLDRMPPPEQLANENDAGLVRHIAQNLAKYYAERQMNDYRREAEKTAMLAVRRQMLLGAAEVPPDQLKARLEQVDKALAALEKQSLAALEKLPDNPNVPERQRVQAAVKAGLIGEALKIMKTSKEPDSGTRALGAIQLQLRAGLLEDALQGLSALQEKLAKQTPDPESQAVAGALPEVVGEASRLAGDFVSYGKTQDAYRPQPRSAAVKDRIRGAVGSAADFTTRYNAFPHGGLGGGIGLMHAVGVDRPLIDAWLRDADYLRRRGMYALLASDLPEARKWFEQALAPDGIPLPSYMPERAVTERYMKLLDLGK